MPCDGAPARRCFSHENDHSQQQWCSRIMITTRWGTEPCPCMPSCDCTVVSFLGSHFGLNSTMFLQSMTTAISIIDNGCFVTNRNQPSLLHIWPMHVHVCQGSACKCLELHAYASIRRACLSHRARRTEQNRRVRKSELM